MRSSGVRTGTASRSVDGRTGVDDHRGGGHVASHGAAHLRGRGDGGQVIVVLAIGLFAIISMAALLVDAGLAFANHRGAQAAADVSALSAAAAAKEDKGPKPREVGEAVGYAIAHENGISKTFVDCNGVTQQDGVSVNIPPDPADPRNLGYDSRYVEVITKRAMRTGFAAVIGLDCWIVEARAVASGVPPSPTSLGPAVLGFVKSNDCGDLGIKITGHDFTIVGGATSNSGVAWSGSNGSVTPDFTYRETTEKPLCEYTGSSDRPPATATSTIGVADPFPYTMADFQCDFNLGDKGQVPEKDKPLVDGTYCAVTSLTLQSSTPITGNITLIAPQVTINAPGAKIDPYQNGVLIYTCRHPSVGTYWCGTGSKVVNFTSADVEWSGIIYAPDGHVMVSGKDGSTIKGYIWADEVEVSGAGVTIRTPDGGQGGGNTALRLVE